jgi:hypothetical protein
METLMTKSALVVDHLVLRTAIQDAEIDLLRQALNEGHYLKAGRPAGHVLWQGIYRTDNETDCPELVAVLCWGGAAKRLKERDNHIGWDSVTCANGLICGAHDVKAIWQKCAPLDQNQRRAIGLTKRNKKTGLLTMPGYGALNDLVNRIDPVELACALNAWLTENSELLPKSLALDGKSIGAKWCGDWGKRPRPHRTPPHRPGRFGSRHQSLSRRTPVDPGHARMDRGEKRRAQKRDPLLHHQPRT